jgi:ADP-dependent phosphofructokinase/glucokinase
MITAEIQPSRNVSEARRQMLRKEFESLKMGEAIEDFVLRVVPSRYTQMACSTKLS